MKLLLTVQYIPDRDSRVVNKVGLWIPRVGFRIPGTGFRIPKPWIPHSKGKKCWILDSGFPYMGRNAATGVVYHMQNWVLHHMLNCARLLSREVSRLWDCSSNFIPLQITSLDYNSSLSYQASIDNCPVSTTTDSYFANTSSTARLNWNSTHFLLNSNYNR